MREPLLRFFSEKSSPGDSWLNRVRENLAQLLIPSHFTPTSANGAPIHLLQFDKTKRAARAQVLSLLTHTILIAAILFFAAKIVDHPAFKPIGGGLQPLIRYRPPDTSKFGDPSLGKESGGGEKESTPATRGLFPPSSSWQLVRPSLPHSETQHLPVPEVILDPQAPATVEAVIKIGIPWMPTDTDSAGPGADHGIGAGKRGGMGDKDGSYAGEGANGPYSNVVTDPICNYCPYPTYTDDARHEKVQGSVTLQVLVGADGRAQQIRVVRGLGFGLDDRAVESVRTWRFVPARDAARRSVPAWVTVEAVFRLF